MKERNLWSNRSVLFVSRCPLKSFCSWNILASRLPSLSIILYHRTVGTNTDRGGEGSGRASRSLRFLTFQRLFKESAALVAPISLIKMSLKRMTKRCSNFDISRFSVSWLAQQHLNLFKLTVAVHVNVHGCLSHLCICWSCDGLVTCPSVSNLLPCREGAQLE